MLICLRGADSSWVLLTRTDQIDYLFHMATWALAEAKAKLSEVVDRAVNHEPQEITRNGKPVAVMVSRDEWVRANRSPSHNYRSMAEFFRNSPLRESGIDLSRSKSTTRKVDL